jgi:hypothetical protein
MCPVFFCLKKENSRVGTAVFAIEGIKKKQELFAICQDVPLQIHQQVTLLVLFDFDYIF